MEIELEKPYDDVHTNLIDMHSVLNVVNVIHYEAYKLSEEIGDELLLDEIIDLTLDVGKKLRDKAQSRKILENIDDFIVHVNSVLENVNLNLKANKRPFFDKINLNLQGIFEIIKIRAGEILERLDNPQGWKEHSIVQLKNNFVNVFRAIEQNSHGAYQIVYNLAKHDKKDYLVNFEINTPNESTVYMPPVFQDVMRDLMANARKYTNPGGKITAGLYQNDEEIKFIVEDDGIGIPAEDLPEVVSFGKRGSNIGGRPTRGAGFGLTKAYYVTQMFGGKMWINSPYNSQNGTQIIIRIPLPNQN